MIKNTILQGDVIDIIKTLLVESVNCIITSPPYFGLRDYGLPPTNWPEVTYPPMAGLPEITIPAMSCCLGLEDSIESYVGHMVLVFRGLWRVLRDDGTTWLNLGDSYVRGNGKQREIVNGSQIQQRSYEGLKNWRPPTANVLKPKNLIGIPWRIAFALQADGWYLRSDVIWAKKNPMPESVTDRPTKAHEYLFLLAKSERYYYDQDAIREPISQSTLKRWNDNPYEKIQNDNYKSQGLKPNNHRGEHRLSVSPKGRNNRSVWTIATKPYKVAHFAVMPETLVEPCLFAGCPAQVCVECGEPWLRMVEKGEPYKTGGGNTQSSAIGPMDRNGKSQWDTGAISNNRASISKGFTPICQCSATPRPGIVLDPFFGSGTVGQVAIKNKRDWLGVELNPEYIKLAKERIRRTQPALFVI